MPQNFRAAPGNRGPNLPRRRLLLVAAGGVAVGLTAVVSHSGGHPDAAAPSGHPGDPAAGGHPGGQAATEQAARESASARAASPTAGRTTPQAGSSSPAPAATAKKTAAAGAGASGHPVYYLDDGPRVIALTIDDGPSPVYTPQVLRILEKYHVRATFSMVGQNVSYHRSIVREVAAAGHTIINHTWDHANLTSLSASRQRTEITRAAEAIETATDVRPRMFRAPYGAWTPQALAYCASEKLTPLDWSVDPRDWARPGVNEIVGTIMKATKTGSIILEHDGGGNRAQTVSALKVVIPRLLDEGFRFGVPT
jgi:peptidoglycan/xylan/chitin deacetylase (PgdA/CDA1 family)